MGKSNDNELLLRLAGRVKSLREKKGVTQEEAYNDTGVHFARIEQGKRDISFTTLAKIARYFGISMAELLGKGF